MTDSRLFSLVGGAAFAAAMLVGQVGCVDERVDPDEFQDLSERLDGLINRQWHDVTDSREAGETYVNETKYPIEVAVSTGIDGFHPKGYKACSLRMVIAGVGVVELFDVEGQHDGGSQCAATATVPPRSRYSVSADGQAPGKIVMWWELRGPGSDVRKAESR